MKINNQLFLNLYLVAAILHIYTLISDNENLIILTKYLLLPMLILHVLVNCRRSLKTVAPLLIGLFFCWAGDVLLIYEDVYEVFFMYGLAAFLLGHIFYLITFRRFRFKNKLLISNKPWILALPLLYSLGLIILIYPSLEELKLPVIVYAAAITMMLIAAINRFGNTDKYSFLFVFGGALFFIISDSIIAISKFYMFVQSSSLLIMSTYIIAQYLITTGILLHVHDSENKA